MKMLPTRSALLFVLLLRANAFQAPPNRKLLSIQSAPQKSLSHFEDISSSAVGPLYFWGNKNKDDSTEAANNDNEDGQEKKKSEKSGGVPFFAGLRRKKEETEEDIGGSVATTESVSEPQKVEKPKPVVEDDPVAKAEALRAQAERARLEAERMDAELTLKKIARLEKEMTAAVAKDDTENVEKIQRQMDALQARMLGETPKPTMPPKKEEEKGPTTAQETMVSDSFKKESENSVNDGSDRGLIGGLQLSYDIGDVEEAAKNLENSPAFMKKLMAQTVDLDFDTADDVNCTEVAVRLNQIKRADFSFSKRPMPTFSQAQIEEAKRKLKTDPTFLTGLDEEVVGAAKGNDTKLALMGLNYNYFMEIYEEGQLEKLVEGEDWLKGVIDAVNKTAIDASIETIYPKCTRKEDAPVPTMAQVQSLMTDVLPKASFTPRGKPEQVVGGYIIRGTSRYENGDDILNAIEEHLSKSNLKDKMTVLVTIDFTLLAQLDEGLLEENVDPDTEPPILYVLGPDITPERRRIPLGLTSALGVASCWYLSIYPFLLNPAIMKRTEEQLALADASMAYDLSWLTELSLPLFLTFISIQLAHEAGHRLAASVNEVELTLPTFVPSLISGITSSVTQFKTPPKNKEALFDISLAGPIAGATASLLALVIGSQLTLVTDPNVLPALPLEILRQSTLGGGIIDFILGGGALSIPEGAAGSLAVAGMTVSLHPVAIAGYIGLIVNSLALLPIGTTDGGRIALATYGRGAKLLVGNIMLFTVFLVGLLGSDLFLFYFAFLIAFQTGNELPARNEVDKISFPRVCLAIGSTVLSLLALIPFQ